MPLDDTNWVAPAPDTQTDETTALLIRARGFLERGWCRYAQAQDENGIFVWPTDDCAVEWCAYGALRAAGMSMGDYRMWDEHPALIRFHAATGGERIDTFNNRQETVEPVLAAFDRAIGGETN